MLWSSRDAELQCEHRLGDAGDPDIRRATIADDEVCSSGLVYGMWSTGASSIVSPDGRFLLVHSPRAIAVIDLDDGKTVGGGIPAVGVWAWSPDSRWLCRADPNGHADAISIDDGRAVRLRTSPRVTRVGATMLAVG